MTATTGPAAGGRETACPKCRRPVPGEGDLVCGGCATELFVLRFAPVVAAADAALAGARCAQHPGKPASAACGRCGSFLCGVCVTRTGEEVLCPACFELLHEREELDTTRARRMRWDHLALTLTVASFVPCVGSVAAPFALVAAIYVPFRLRREPWMSRAMTWGNLAFWGLALAVAVVAVAASS